MYFTQWYVLAGIVTNCLPRACPQGSTQWRYMESLSDNFLGLMAGHALLTYVVIFLTCVLEALVLVGLIIPGSSLMVGLGAILATGAISWEISLVAAIAGAILGDYLSFWLGHHFHENIEKMWPFAKYPQLIKNGTLFFKRHGGKSVFLGRFFAPVRPMIPFVAGMMDMPQKKFLLFNSLSAVAWVVVHWLPGLILGKSLMMSGMSGARFTFLVFVILMVLWLALWPLWRGLQLLFHHDRKREWVALNLLAIPLMLAFLFLAVTRALLPLELLNQIDNWFHSLLTALRAPWSDHLMIIVSELGDWVVNLAIIIVVFVILMVYAKYRTAAFWAAAGIGGALLVSGLKWLFKHKRPIDIYDGISVYSFPSGHATMSAVIYGFLALLCLRWLGARVRWLLLSAAIAVPVIVSFSRIYLGAHWLSDVLAGLFLGWAWVVLLGSLYVRQHIEILPRRPLLWGVLATVLLVGSINICFSYRIDIARYVIR